MTMQLAIITKYNLASCCQTTGESDKCIKYLSQASKLLTFYSNVDSQQDQNGLFKVGMPNNNNTNNSSTNNNNS